MSRKGWSGDANTPLEPTIYRAIIDDVVLAMKPEFDEYGVSEDVLAALQHVSTALGTTQPALPGANALYLCSEMGDQGHCLSRRRLRSCERRPAAAHPTATLSYPAADDSPSFPASVHCAARTWSDDRED
jgi:hypothetical protein